MVAVWNPITVGIIQTLVSLLIFNPKRSSWPKIIDTLVLMGRSAKSVARVYADVNARFGASWYEYGTIATITTLLLFTAAFADNLQVQWGSQDHYEIVRKVGRGKYSEVSTTFRLG